MNRAELAGSGAPGADIWAADVPRTDMLDLYEEAIDRRVVLVTAPAGYGKSVLARQWCGVDPSRPFVHHVLTPDDNDASVLSLRLTAGLRAYGPHEPVLVVLDDVHRVTSSASIVLLRQLVDTLPAGSQLVLAGRADPDVGLSILRASGDVLEIRCDRLAMDLDTATLLVWAANVPMSGCLIEDLHRRTEGWPAGLSMAVRSLRVGGSDEPNEADVAACERAMLGYLFEEVVARQDDDVRNFLVQSSAMPSFSAELCVAVLDGPGTAAALAAAIRSNLFLIPVDGRPGWYRHHRLLRELLLDELEQVDPSARRRLGGRAAAWHAAEVARAAAVVALGEAASGR